MPRAAQGQDWDGNPGVPNTELCPLCAMLIERDTTLSTTTLSSPSSRTANSGWTSFNCLSFGLSAGRRVLYHHPAFGRGCYFWIQCNSVCLRPLRYHPQCPGEGTGLVAEEPE